MPWREDSNVTMERMNERLAKGDLTLDDVAAFLTAVVKELTKKIDEQEKRIKVLEDQPPPSPPKKRKPIAKQ